MDQVWNLQATKWMIVTGITELISRTRVGFSRIPRIRRTALYMVRPSHWWKKSAPLVVPLCDAFLLFCSLLLFLFVGWFSDLIFSFKKICVNISYIYIFSCFFCLYHFVIGFWSIKNAPFSHPNSNGYEQVELINLVFNWISI